MSVSDVDLKRVMAVASSSTPLPRTAGHTSNGSDGSDWNTSLSGIITDCKGELMQLDPISTPLDLKDPSTPARKRPVSGRTNSENLTATTSQHERPSTKHAATFPSVPTVRTSSVESSPTQRDGPGFDIPTRSSSISQSRPLGLRYGPRSPGSRNTLVTSPVRDSNRLQVQHRSTASSSEPSLIPVREGIRNCAYSVYLSDV